MTQTTKRSRYHEIEDRQIRSLAERLARELDVHADRVETSIRTLLARGLIELHGSAETHG